jgi:uncharacterized protein YecE (DUF72 family)
MEPLAGKLLCLLLQLPPSMTMKKGLKKVERLPLDKRFRYAVEVRHESWFKEEAYSFFKENDICLVWSQLAKLQTPAVVTTDFIYLRLIGDRSIDEKEFGTLQKDRMKEMKHWAGEVMKAQSNKKLKRTILASNNHYAGFGPGTVNIFRKMLGLPEAAFGDKVPFKDEKQATLSDF